MSRLYKGNIYNIIREEAEELFKNEYFRNKYTRIEDCINNAINNNAILLYDEDEYRNMNIDDLSDLIYLELIKDIQINTLIYDVNNLCS